MQALQRSEVGDANPLLTETRKAVTPPGTDRREAGDPGEMAGGLYRILAVEDDPTITAFYSRIMQEYNLPVDTSLDGHDALERLTATTYDLVITDLSLPGLDGLSLLQWIQHNRPTTRTVVITGDGRAESILAALRAGASDYLVKPFTLYQFREMIDRCKEPQDTTNRQVFSSLMKQVMHDVHGETVDLEVMIKLLKQGGSVKIAPEVGHELETMLRKVEQLKGLTEDYCILARNLLQGGVIPTERIELRGEVIKQVLGEMQPALERKEITVVHTPDLSAEKDVVVMGNRVMLKSLFRTLFNNAIRQCYPAGTLSYGISSNGRRYKIHVANEGDVVPVQQQAGIFDECIRVREGECSLAQGEGLGLSMAKDIVRQHGGDIWYESIGNGSKFVCTIPSSGAQTPEPLLQLCHITTPP